MPDLANLTVEECNFLLKLLKREESRWQSSADDRLGDEVSTDRETRERTLKDLRWRLQVACSPSAASDEELEKEVLTEGLAGYY